MVVVGVGRSTRGASCRSGWWLWLSAIVAGVEASLGRDAAMILKACGVGERWKEELPVEGNEQRKTGGWSVYTADD